jgi:PAS domain S-box-containing protein
MTLSSPPDFNPDTYATLAAMVDVAPLLIASIGPDQRYRLVNAEYEKIWGKPRDWFVGRRVADTLPEEIYRRIEPYLHTALAGTAVDFEYEGHYVPSEPLVLRDMRARYTPNIVNGRQDGIVVVVEDITDYRSVERAMRTAQQQLRDIVDNVPVFIAYYDADWRYRFVNSAYEHWYGQPRDWFVGRTVQEVMGDGIYRRILPQLQRAMDGEAINFSFERLSPDGSEVRILDTYLVPDHGPHGVQGIYTMVTDDTERRLAEDAALRAQWEMRAVADNLPALITYIDADLRYRYVNAGFLSWYQLPVHAFIGKRVEDVVGEVYALTGPLMQRALRGESIDFDYPRRNERFSDADRVLRVRLLPDTVAGVTRGFIALIEDITDARHADDALRQAARELRAVINAIPALVAAFDVDARFTYVNRQFAEWCGQPEDWFPGRRLADVLTPELAPRVLPYAQRVMAGERVTFGPTGPARRPSDGAERHYRVEFAPFMDGAEQRGFVGIAQDVTDSVETNRALQEQETRLHQIANASSEAFCLTNLRRTELIYASPAHERIFGISNADLVQGAMTWIDMVHGDDRARVADEFAGTLARGSFVAEYRLVRANGEVCWVHDKADLVRNDEGVVIGLASIISDITERREQQKLIERNAARLAQAQRAAKLGLWELDLLSGDIYWSPEMRALVELDADEPPLTIDNYTEFLHPDDVKLVTEAVASAIAGLDTYDIEHRVVLRSGRQVLLHSQATIEREADGTAQRMTGLVRDITERHEAQQALLQSEMRLRQITETITDSFWLLTLDSSTPFYVSPGFELIFGRPSSSARGNAVGWLESIHPQDRQRMSGEFTAMLHGAPLDSEYRIVRPNGEVRWVHDKGRSVRDARGIPLAIAGVTSDVTERRRQHSELVEYARRLERAQLVGNLGFWQIDLGDNSLLWSDQLRRIFDLPISRSTNTFDEFLNRVHPDDRDIVQSHIGSAIANSAGYDFDHRIVRGDGEIRHIHEQGSVERDSQGRAQRLVGIGQDITARKQIELVAKESELRLRQITEHVDQVFWLLEAGTGKLIYVSPAYEGTWDLPPASAYDDQRLWLTRVHGDDLARLREVFLACLRSGQVDVEFRIVKSSGEIRWMRGRGFPIEDDQGRLYRIAGFVEDITDGKRIAELQRLKDEAESANRTKSEFLSKMSHELRTPLNAILGFSQLMHYDKRHPLCDEQRESVDEILAAGRHLLDIVDEMLDLTRIEIGKLRVAFERVNLRDTCGECLAMVQSEARHRHIDVHFTPPAGADPWVMADRTRVRQILLNLLGNAVKYNHPRGQVVLSLDSDIAPGYVRVTVADNGPGLSAEQIGKLFVPFQRLDAERISVEGLGLGLALSKQLAEAMGGNLGAVGAEGKGCTFWLDLPVAGGN